ncbi:MAG TPA: MFS transporter [Gemmatimonadales bacterium]|nr:MFS transporter [Gemmatimonadales bacterium]
MTTPANSPRRILFASLVGTAIEFFDFYIYGTAAVLVFPQLFFPSIDPAAATLASLATFAIAFFARPVGAALFGHFGDRIGRKATLVAALLTMGVSTVVIGLLPTYHSIGILAPVLLALCRFGQGLGLGGEWGGAVLLAVENAPPGKRAWYGMFPQLGAPVGLFFSGAVFLLLTTLLSDEQFLTWGWRVPFVASALLVALGLYVRLAITETPVFAQAMERRVKLPMLTVARQHWRPLGIGILVGLSTFVLFYVMTVFTLSWGTTAMGYTRDEFLVFQLWGSICFAIAIPISALFAERARRRTTLIINLLIVGFGVMFATLFEAGPTGALMMTIAGMALIGLIYAPLGTQLSEQFPTPVRYSGTAITYNLSAIVGASLAPYAATWLAQHHGLQAVGWYVAASGALAMVGLMMIREARDEAL